MDKSTLTRTAIAGSVAAAGLTLGGIGLAASATDDDGERPERHFVMGGPFGENLADELGVSEDELQDAMEAVHDELGPPDIEDGRPTGEEIEQHRSQLAAALADELGIEATKVEAAFENLHEEARADARERLADRLDEAVADGELTAADKASVLKAFDAEVLGGPHGGPGFGMHHRRG